MRRSALFILPIYLLFCTGCAADDTAMQTRTEALMGTYVTVTLSPASTDPQAALDAAFARAQELEQIFSPTIADSELNHVNASAFSQDTAVSEDFAHLLSESLYYMEISDGAFNCTIGKLIDLWGIGTEDAHVPTKAEITSLLPETNSVSLSYDGIVPLVRFSDETVQLHFGAVAKGYIADEMEKVLSEHGIEDAIISLGGNVLTMGQHPEKQAAWTIGITDPHSPSDIIGTVQVSGMSVVTSGNYERYFEENGVRFHHILDPSTGYPANAGLSGTTIIAASSLDCDALSTAVYVLGAEEGLALIEFLPDTEAILIMSNGKVRCSSGIENFTFRQVME